MMTAMVLVAVAVALFSISGVGVDREYSRDWDSLEWAVDSSGQYVDVGIEIVDAFVEAIGFQRPTAITAWEDLWRGFPPLLFTEEQNQKLEGRSKYGAIETWQEVFDLGVFTAKEARRLRAFFDLSGPWPWSRETQSLQQPPGPDSETQYRYDYQGTLLVDWGTPVRYRKRLIQGRDQIEFLYVTLLSKPAADALLDLADPYVSDWRTVWGMTYTSDAEWVAAQHEERDAGRDARITEEQALFMRVFWRLHGLWFWDESQRDRRPIYPEPRPLLPNRQGSEAGTTHSPVSADEACAYIRLVNVEFNGWSSGWAVFRVRLHWEGCGSHGAENVSYRVSFDESYSEYWWLVSDTVGDLGPGEMGSASFLLYCPANEWARFSAYLVSDGTALSSCHSGWFVPPQITGALDCQ